MSPIFRSASIAVSMSLLFLTACNDEPSVSGLDTVERLVVVGTIASDSSGAHIRVSRTLSFSETYGIGSDAIIDAQVTIRQGSSSYTGVSDSLGNYRFPGFYPQSGVTFTLGVEWNGLKCSAVTVVPFSPSIENMSIQSARSDSAVQLISLSLRAEPTACYGLTWGLARGSAGPDWQPVKNVRRGVDADGEGLIHLDVEAHFAESDGNSLLLQVRAYDAPLYDYFISRGSSRPGQDDRIFPNLGGPATWNVKGDGVGIVVGMTTAPAIRAR